MDDSVLAQFESSFLISSEVNDPQRIYPHYYSYKSKKKVYTSQEERRAKFLEEQLSRRRNFADHARKIAEGGELSEVEEDDGDVEETIADQVDTVCNGGDSVQKYTRRNRCFPYKNQLMLSEWLLDIPSDFEQNWLVVVVPVGKRSLVVSARKTTYAYSRSGAVINNFPSLLPGGCRRMHRQQRDYCILDCIFHDISQSYFILDVMCWHGHPVYNSDTEFRTFWKQQKCKEHSEISKYSRINPLPFQDLCYHPATRESLTQILAETPPYQVDGLLFIHKECRYIIGRTPLALWLKPHMIPDVLGIQVSAEFLACSPVMEPYRKRSEKMDTSVEGRTSSQGKMDTAVEVDKVLSSEKKMDVIDPEMKSVS